MRYWFAQFLGWTAYSMVIFLVLYTEGQLTLKGVLHQMVFSLIGISVSHAMRWVFIKWNFFQLKPVWLTFRICLVAIGASFFFQFIYSVGTHFLFKRELPKSLAEIIIEVLLMLFLFLVWIVIYFFYHSFQKARFEEIKNLQLADSQKEIELQNLRTQLNPHFLFNALNSIRALIEIEPKLAKNSITKLSNILRNSLVYGRKSSVTIQEECDFVRDYLDLEKVRFEERLTVEWNVDEAIKHELIPPLIIQTLVENAIKHGISNLKNGGLVSISCFVLDDKLVIEIRNTGKIQTEIDLGIGIQNTIKRLNLMYGNRASFSLLEENNEVVARIYIAVS
jgi:two-component system, LytTR family, sensor kinase